MKISDFAFGGVKLIEFDVFCDGRGFFAECLDAEAFERHGLPGRFALVARSRSEPGVIRGLHLQYRPPQAKLVGVVHGRIWDVVVDLRCGSPTFGKWSGIELSGDAGRLLWIPFGFAHGFCVVGDGPADVLYHLDAPHGPSGEGGIRWSDPQIGIPWPVADPIVSPKDAGLPTLEEFKRSPPSGWG